MLATPPEILGIGVEDLAADSRPRDPDTVSVPDHGGCIDHDEQVGGSHSLRGLPEKGPDRVLDVLEINPLESLGKVVQQKEGWFVPVDPVKMRHEPLHASMRLMGEQMPVDAVGMVPLPPLGDLPSLEEEFFPGMGPHPPQEHPQIRRLLPVALGHLVHEGSLAVDHLVVAEH